MTSFARHVVHRYLDFIHARPWSAAAIAFAVTAALAPLISQLELRSSLKELLPKDSPSVIALDHVIDHVGGVGTVLVAIEGADVEANKRFADALAAGLATLPTGLIRFTEHKIDPIKDFFEVHALSYLTRSELEQLRGRLELGYEATRRRADPFYVDLEDDKTTASDDLDITQLEKVEARKIAELSPLRLVGTYYGVDDGRLLVMMIRPFGSNVSVEHADRLITSIRGVADALQPQTFGSGVRYGLTGSFMTAIEEYETLKADIVSTAVLCFVLVFLAIVLYFRRLRPALLLGVTLLVGLVWTLALTRVAIGYFNSQTAFLGSIILGTGINCGIIVLGRYYEERRAGVLPTPAMRRALEITAKPTLIAALTTAIAFGVLLIAGVRSLSQFGIIGSLGILSCWLATMTVLPELVLISERLRNRTSIDSGTDALDRKVGRVFKNSTVPTVMHVDTLALAAEVRDAIAARVASEAPELRFVDSTTSIFDVLPTDQEAKLPVLRQIRELLGTRWLGKVEATLHRRLARVRDALDGRVLGPSDLPDELARPFTDLQSRRGTVVYVNPSPEKFFSDGHNLIGFAATLRELKLADGTIVSAAGDPTIFADLIEIIRQQAPFLTLASFVAVIAVVMLALRSARRTIIMVLTIVGGIVLMMGVCAAMELRINFFNFIIVPLTIGIGVDYSINMMTRLGSDTEHTLAHVIRHTGGAVLLCSVTTMIGYFVLTRADNQALASFGWAAMVGEIAAVVSAILLVPTLFALDRRLATHFAVAGGRNAINPELDLS